MKNKFYNEYDILKSWDSKNPKIVLNNQEYRSELKGLLNGGTKNILEIGCGSGQLLLWLIKNGHNVKGIDLNNNSVSNLSKMCLDVTYGDANEIIKSIHINFDLIILMDVFEHIELDDISNLLDNLSKVMTKKSVIVCRFPNTQSPFGLYYQNGDPTHMSNLSLTRMDYLCRVNKLKIIDAKNSFQSRSGLIKFIVFILRSIIYFYYENILSRIIYGKKILFGPNISIRIMKD